MAEGLHRPPDRESAGSKGPLFGGKSGRRISVHHNLIAHNVGRNPMIKSAGLVDLVNNVIFVPAAVGIVVDGELGACHVNVISNLLLAPAADGRLHGVRVLGQRPVSLFVRGNLGPYRTRDDQPEDLFVSDGNNSRSYLTDSRRAAPRVTTLAARDAYEEVLRSAGCIVPQRDAVDRRIMADVVARRTRVVNDPAEVGGWPELHAGAAPRDSDHDGMPDDYERTRALDPQRATDAAHDADGDGYTNIEEYLDELVQSRP
jgi:hypothetical protein